MLNTYLARNPEAFVDYRIFVHNVKPIDTTEIEQLKEVTNYFIKNLNLSIEKCEELKQLAEKKDLYAKKIAGYKKLLRQYNKVLECLEFNKTVGQSRIPDVEDFISESCLDITNIINTKNALKSNKTSDSNQKLIYELYDKKLNLNQGVK